MSDQPLLWMTHPGIPGIESQVTTQDAFDEIWEAKGWELIPYGTDPIATPVHLTQADMPYLRDRAHHIGLDEPTTPVPSNRVDEAFITADITGITIDALNIDLLAGLAVDIPDLDVAVEIEARIAVSHSVANATVHAVLCKTSPTPTTILNSIGQYGFVALSAIGSKGISIAKARLPAHTPCTVQCYIAGTSGTAAVSAQVYSPCEITADKVKPV